MKVQNWKDRLQRQEQRPIPTTASSPHTPRMSANKKTNAINIQAINIANIRIVAISYIDVTDDSIRTVQGYQAISEDLTIETRAEVHPVVI